MKINRTTIILAGVFLLIAALLIILEANAVFPDADSFYHAKMAMTVRDQGFIKTFPWFQWMAGKDNYVNPHLLYHLLLIPLVTFFPPMVGMKISAVGFGLMAFGAIFLMLRAFKTPMPWFFLLAAVLSGDFLFRMSMPRAPALSVAILLLGTWAVMRTRPLWLLTTATVFVWLYHGWPVLLLSLLADFAAQTASIILEDRGLFSAIKIAGKKRIKIYFMAISGLALGLIINPYFPQNLQFSILDIFKIGVINYQAFLPVGQEWLPLEIGNLITGNLIVFLLLAIGLGGFLPALKNQQSDEVSPETRRSLFTFIFLAGGFVILSLKSYRFVEYALPFLVLAAGNLWKINWPFFQNELWPLIKIRLKKTLWRQPVVVGFLTVFLAAILGNEFLNLNQTADDYFRIEQYAPATDWLKQNLPAKEIVFHNSWDFSPILWYLDDKHFYLAGLDPTFMYDYDPEIFNLWWAISCGENPEVAQIGSVFRSRVVIVDRRFDSAEKLIFNLENSGLFREVQKNDWVSVYADYSL